MPKRKRDLTPLPSRPTKRNDGAPPAQGQPEASETTGHLPLSLSNEQLQQVSQAVADILSSNYLALTPSYDNDLGHRVPNRLKLKIVNGDYINLGLLLENSHGVDPKDETKYFSMKEGNLTLAPKTKAKVINGIQVWTDGFLIYASIYASAHAESRVQLFKYIHTIRLGASRVKTLGWRDYDIQFRLKKKANPSLSFAIVKQELWLLYMYSAPSTQISSPQASILKCYEFNYKGLCHKLACQYKHECMICSQNHPYIKHKTSSGSSLNFRSGGLQATWRPQLPRRPIAPSSAIRVPYTQSARPQ
ncbi:uncharacterized protein LOC133174598 [Saccostrea echinata]|uniref:uncharacterized protein LOC133174598 n=1 Tax=Saccostrea echinata TaxID=191078 RepID=UPI002A8203B2|nr:uncharacterized protein LOC133174598 [Saccostrea echinata]